MTNPSWFTILAWLHGGFYFLTGIWPIISIDTFQRVTGPKTDLWLVRTVGSVLAVIGLAIGVAGYRDSPSPEIILLAVGAAASLTAIDVIYVSLKVIAPVYLLDAIAEVLLIAAWLAVAATV